jgi:hypothetical protein
MRGKLIKTKPEDILMEVHSNCTVVIADNNRVGGAIASMRAEWAILISNTCTAHPISNDINANISSRRHWNMFMHKEETHYVCDLHVL